MAALTKERSTPARDGAIIELGVTAAKKCIQGGLAVLDASGYLKPAVTATGLVPLGRFMETVDNTAGADGAVTARVEPGIFRWANSAGADEIAIAEIGDACYIVDDQTVAKTDGGGARSKAGLIFDVDAQGVWVWSGPWSGNVPATALLAANNLSDVGTAATAFANIKQAATTAATGVAELATSAETLTGTDAVRAVTPKGAADTYATKFGAPTFVIGAEAGNVINVGIQLTDAGGADLAVRGAVMAYLSDDANGDSIAAAAASGGVAIGTDGLAIPLVANKAFQLTSEVDGDIDLNITEAGAATWHLILVMPDGRLAASGAITFA